MKLMPLTIAAVLFALPAFALVPINEEKHINDTLIQGFVADAITDNCPTMKPRKFKGLTELLALRDYALNKGYSRDEIKAFVEDPKEKARGKATAAAILKKRGAVPGKSDAYCAIGVEEIAKGSLIGQLLRNTQ